MGLWYYPRTTTRMTRITAPPKSCSFAHWRRPFLLSILYFHLFWSLNPNIIIYIKSINSVLKIIWSLLFLHSHAIWRNSVPFSMLKHCFWTMSWDIKSRTRNSVISNMFLGLDGCKVQRFGASYKWHIKCYQEYVFI